MVQELWTKFLGLFSEEALVAIGASGVVLFVVSVIAIPYMLVRLPADYFDIRIPRPWMRNHHPVLRVAGHVLKNILGAVFLLAGLAMLVLPGQGILTIVIGVSLLEFPGKRRLEARLVGQPKVLIAINALRERFGRPPLVLAPHDAEEASAEATRQHSATAD